MDSVRAIKDHKYIPAPYFWQIPGECDLSAYVNFGALAQFAEVKIELSIEKYRNKSLLSNSPRILPVGNGNRPQSRHSQENNERITTKKNRK